MLEALKQGFATSVGYTLGFSLVIKLNQILNIFPIVQNETTQHQEPQEDNLD